MKLPAPSSRAILECEGRYSRFSFRGWTLTFRHGKDLLRYLAVKDFASGILVLDCLGRVKGRYEDYVDLPHLLRELLMDPATALDGLSGVDVAAHA